MYSWPWMSLMTAPLPFDDHERLGGLGRVMLRVDEVGLVVLDEVGHRDGHRGSSTVRVLHARP